MNGVRRLLGGGGQRSQSPTATTTATTTTTRSSLEQYPSPPPTTTPLVIPSSKPSWPPSPLSQGRPTPKSSMDSTASDNFSSSYPKALPASPPTNAVAGPSSPIRPLPSRVAQLAQKSLPPLDHNWNRSSIVDTRDELLMSLLASEAILDSKDFPVLTAEEVEELKKEQKVLSSRLEAMAKKLQLESKIRDAASSLVKINSSNKSVSKQSSDQLDTANRKVETVQKEVWRLRERSSEIDKKLLEHQAAVLSHSLRRLESKSSGETDDSGYGTAYRASEMSPTSSETSYSSFRGKFEGAHLFAGHVNAIVPSSPRKPVSAADLSLLESRVKELASQLQAANDIQLESKREISHLHLEKVEMETSLSIELQMAEEKISQLQAEIDSLLPLEKEKGNLQRELQVMQRELDMRERRLEVMEEKSGEALGMELRVFELDAAIDSLRDLMHSHGISYDPEEKLVAEYISWLRSHLEDLNSRMSIQDQQIQDMESLRQQLEQDVKTQSDRNEALSREITELKRSREEDKQSIKSLETRLREQPISSPSLKALGDLPSDVKKLISILLPVWNALPSPETRASKFGQRKISPSSNTPGSPNTSLSELDVRLLKTLYDGRPGYNHVENSGVFTIEGFAARVQALILDDRALIERLIRFAQAHDLLKKNAERAQKLAQESSIALETYQKQVKALEDRNLTLASSITTLQDEVRDLQEAVEKAMVEKRNFEVLAAEKSETCRQLLEANNVLSAKAQSLAEDVASAPEAVRKELGTQLEKCKAELDKANEELHEIRTAEQTQRIALLDELNNIQTDNANLRAQLRAVKK